MARKLTIYPKTERFRDGNKLTIITEKLDGSNLGLSKQNGDIVIYQRNNSYTFTEMKENKEIRDMAYKGLFKWLSDNYNDLMENLLENNSRDKMLIIFGEWIQMGQLKYRQDRIPNNSFWMFARGKGEDESKLSWDYNYEYFNYAFKDGIKPSYINIVPIVLTTDEIISKQYLDTLYQVYTNDIIKDKSEGFIIYNGFYIKKYVRISRGKEVEFNPDDRKGE